MPTLRKAQDGHYFVLHHYQDFHTWQIDTDGVFFLKRRGVEEDTQFSTNWFMQLWRNAWLYVGTRPGSPPGPVVIGDADVPSSLRKAIQEFHAAVWSDDLKLAWRFGSKVYGLQELIRAIIPNSVAADEMFRRLEEADFEQFRQKIRRINGPRRGSWQLRDIRTVLSGFEYVATIAVRTSVSADGDAAADCDEIWTTSLTGWRVNYDRLTEFIGAG